jgi:hypothetical protein
VIIPLYPAYEAWGRGLVQIADLRVEIRELRVAVAGERTDKSAPLDLPRLPLRFRTQMN